jgi:adenylylsulfate kinase
LKGLYKAAEAGKITRLPGFQVAFEKPHRPNITINTDKESPVEAAKKILYHLDEKTCSTRI